MSEAVTPFTVETATEEIEDLRRRLRATRWPEAETTGDWNQGIPLQYVQTVWGPPVLQFHVLELGVRDVPVGQHLLTDHASCNSTCPEITLVSL